MWSRQGWWSIFCWNMFSSFNLCTQTMVTRCIDTSCFLCLVVVWRGVYLCVSVCVNSLMRHLEVFSYTHCVSLNLMMHLSSLTSICLLFNKCFYRENIHILLSKLGHMHSAFRGKAFVSFNLVTVAAVTSNAVSRTLPCLHVQATHFHKLWKSPPTFSYMQNLCVCLPM